MAHDELQELLAALDAEPGNALLRMTIIRRLIRSGAKSHAAELALALDDQQITHADDRRLVAMLLTEAGLNASAWRAEGAPVEEVPAAEEPSRRLRVVGGRDRGLEDRSIELPEPPMQALKFTDVGGLDDVKKEIERRIIAPFKQKALFAKFGKRVGGGVLLYGPPGCGKTMLARATAGECGLPFEAISIPEILDPYFGVAEQRLAGVFATARSRAPAVLFFDEIDALAAKRSAMMASHVAQLVSHFLNEMDGAKNSNEGLLILAATNIPWAVDSAFLRPGRFDRLFFVPPPDRPAREAILRLELKNRPVSSNIDIGYVADRLSGHSGADLSGVIERATDAAIDASMAEGRDVPITQDMLVAASREVSSSVLDWLTTARNYATYSNEGGRYNEILAFLQKHGRK